MVKHPKFRLSLQFSLKVYMVLSIVIFFLASFFVYFFSDDSRIKVLTCSGNRYYNDQQIYDQAQISLNTRLWLTPLFVLENRIDELPLIDSVQIERNQNRLMIEVKEKTVIGYYVEDNKNYALVFDGDPVEISSNDLSEIVHFPLLAGFTQSQLKSLQKEFENNKKELTQDVIEKIAEIIPYESSYDANMLQITMQDGNTVYTSLDSLHMLSNYMRMLPSLQGKNACLFLDGENSAIEKVNCDAFDPPSKEDKEKDEKEDSDSDSGQKSTEGSQEDQSEEQADDTQEATEESTTESSAETQQSQDYVNQANDWQVDNSAFGMQYSAALNLYYDPGTNTYYRWNETSLSFDVVN